MNICVYGSSSTQLDKVYYESSYELGRQMAQRGHSLVFGGGAQGVMGSVAAGVHDNGGRVLGVAPRFFDVDGILYEHCDEFLYTDTMRERKQLMEDNSDAFIIAPGGLGTFDEFFEILTLKQLGRHNKAIVLYNVMDYYDKLVDMIYDSIYRNFAKPTCKKLFTPMDTAEDVLDFLDAYVPEDIVLDKLTPVNKRYAYDGK